MGSDDEMGFLSSVHRGRTHMFRGLRRVDSPIDPIPSLNKAPFPLPSASAEKLRIIGKVMGELNARGKFKLHKAQRRRIVRLLRTSREELRCVRGGESPAQVDFVDRIHRLHTERRRALYQNWNTQSKERRLRSRCPGKPPFDFMAAPVTIRPLHRLKNAAQKWLMHPLVEFE